MGHLRNRTNAARGIVLVEAALIFPILIFLTFAVMEYGWLFLKYQHITNAARQGARVAARVDATNGDVDNAIQTILTAENITNYTKAIVPGDVSGLETGIAIKVTVTVPYSDI